MSQRPAGQYEACQDCANNSVIKGLTGGHHHCNLCDHGLSKKCSRDLCEKYFFGQGKNCGECTKSEGSSVKPRSTGRQHYFIQGKRAL